MEADILPGVVWHPAHSPILPAGWLWVWRGGSFLLLLQKKKKIKKKKIKKKKKKKKHKK